MSNDGGVVARCPGKSTTVTDLLLDVADDCSFGALGDGEDIADVEGGLLAAVDKCTGVEALCGNECLFAELVAVWIPENDTGERCTSNNTKSRRKKDIFFGYNLPARIVNDFFYYSTYIAVALSEIQRAQTGWVFVKMSVRFEL